MSDQNLRLTDLFQYIEKLFTPQTHNYQYYKQNGNSLSHNIDYWIVAELVELQNSAKDINSSGIKLQFEAVDKPIIILNRQEFPNFPIPEILEGWVDLNLDKGELIKRDFISKLELFDDSSERTRALKSLTKAQKSLFGETETPSELKGWVTVSEDKSGNNSYDKIEQRNVEEKFEDSNRRLGAFKALEKEFASFLKEFEIQRKINKTYDGFHQKYFDLKGRDDKRISLSVCLLKGKLGEEDFLNYLVDIPLKIELNSKSIEIFCDINEKVEQNWDFFALLDSYFDVNKIQGSQQRKEQVIEAANKFSNQEFVNPLNFTDSQYLDYVNALASIFPKPKNIFLEDGLVSFLQASLEENSTDIEISFSPMLRVLDIDNRVYIKQDAANIISKILQLEKEGLTDLIPDFFKKLFEVESLQNEAVEDAELQNIEDGGTGVEEGKILFPLPSNGEQEAIAKRLKYDTAVTVMGPPGTGKSHTIANLISNYVADGKNILVVSQNAKALEVLYGKLPKDVQNLAVTFEDKKTASSDLQSSVQTILSNLSRDYSDESVKALETSLKGIKEEITQTKENLYSALKRNKETKKIVNFLTGNEEEKTLQEWAELLYEQPLSPEYMKDTLKQDSDTERLVKQVIQLKDICKSLSTEELGYYNLDNIFSSKFFSYEEFKELVDSINELKEGIPDKIYEKYKDKIIPSDTAVTIGNLKSRVEILKDDLRTVEFIDSIKSYKKLNSIYLKTTEFFKKITQLQEELENYKIQADSLSGYEPEDVLKKLEEILSKSGDKIPLSLRLNKFDRLLSRILELKINGRIIHSSKDIEVIIKFFQAKDCEKKISILFENHSENINTESAIKFKNWENEYSAMNSAYLLNKYVEEINEKITKSKLPQIEQTSFKTLQASVEILDEIQKANVLFTEEKKISDQVDSILSQERLHPVLRKLAEIISSKNVSQYKKTKEEYEDIEKKILKAKEVYELYTSIRVDFPETADALFDKAKDGNLSEMTREAFLKELAYMKLKQIIDEATNKINSSGKLNEKLHNLQESMYRKTSELIAQKAWKHKVESISDEERRALSAWHFAVTAMGRGYGRNTERYREDAQKNLGRAKSAVPIWIMRLYTAIRYFSDVTPGQFDVLIIDEASQCDITALNLIFRSKKVVVVGDDNQTAVDINSLRFPIEFTNQILDRYLHGHRFKEQFNINANNHSVYALSTVLYPNIISLREHFRCLPEIINYSRRYIYDNKIVPLRTTASHPFGKPVEIIYVEDNSEEKENIVKKVQEKILEFIKTSEEDNSIKLPTVGILCLDSSNQKHKQALQTMLRQDQLISNYIEDMNLLVGTSREFQGDERDIMILTTTVTHSINDKGELRPPTAVMSEEYKRIYNVAASRARDKSILIHSIRPDAIPLMNKDCWRQKLVTYYENIEDEEFQKKFTRDELLSLTDPNSGDFEKSVCNFLIDNNYGDFLKPQYEIGPYKIDFGVVLPSGEDKSELKLAIECDGYQYHSSADQVRDDVDRQLILERAGWQFYRLNSIEWYGKRDLSEDKMRKWLIEKSKR